MNKRLIAICIALNLSVALFVGCSTDGSQNPNVTQSPVQNKKEKKVTVQLANFETFDPAYISTIDSSTITSNCYEGLVGYKQNTTEVVPLLATSWEIGGEQKEYTFKIRNGVKFHDGTELKADSVIDSYSRQMGANAKPEMTYASFVFDSVEKLDKIDDYTVKITLKSPNAAFLSNLAMPYASPIISSTALKKYGDNIGKNPVGTGPFKFVNWEEKKEINLIKNNEYWGTKVKIDKLVFKIVNNDFQTRVNELTNGTIDISSMYGNEEVNKINPDKLSIFKSETMRTIYLSFNTSKAPFNDKKMREAICHVIDRNQMYEKSGTSGEIAQTLLPNFIPGYNSKVKAYEYNIEKANELLKDVNKEPLNLKIAYNFEENSSLAKVVQNGLNKVGIKSTLNKIDKEEDFINVIKNNEVDIVIDGWMGDNGDPDNFLFLLESNQIENVLNISKYINKDYDELITKGRTIANMGERIDIYKKLEEIIADEAPILPLFHGGITCAYSKRIKDFSIHPTGIIMFKNIDIIQ